MTKFCAQCGAAAEGLYCASCGAKAGQATAAVAAPPSASSNAASPVLKIILIVVGALFLLGALGAAGLIFLGYKAKDRIVAVAKEEGFDLESSRREPSRQPAADGCQHLTAEEASAILGVKITRAGHLAPEGCAYFAGQADEQVLSFEVRSEGRNSWAALRLSAKISDGLSGEAEKRGVKLFETVDGVGDKAVFAPLASVLFVLKGDSLVQVNFLAAEIGREKKLEIARKLVSKL